MLHRKWVSLESFTWHDNYSLCSQRVRDDIQVFQDGV